MITPSTQLNGPAYSAGPFFSWRRLVHLQYDSDMDDRESRSSRSLIMEAARLGDVAWSHALARDGTFGRALTRIQTTMSCAPDVAGVELGHHGEECHPRKPRGALLDFANEGEQVSIACATSY